MTFDKWFARIGRFLSGRAGIERWHSPTEVPNVELPEIEAPDRVSSVDGKEQAHLERKRRETDIELARLRAIAQNRYWR